MMKNTIAILLIISIILILSSPVFAEENVVANRTSSNILIDGKKVAFDSFNIDGHNYLKLRDLAYAVSSTAKQFDVSWDSVKNSINLTSNSPYTVAGDEMSIKGAGRKLASKTVPKIYLDGVEVQIEAYHIDNSHYFMLRDIGLIFDFAVDWEEAISTVSIDTSKPNPCKFYTFDDSKYGVQFSVAFPKSWRMVEQKAPPPDTLREGAFTSGIRFIFEDAAELFGIDANLITSTGIVNIERFTSVDFKTIGGVKGVKYSEFINGHAQVFYIFELFGKDPRYIKPLDVPGPYYFAYVQMNEEKYTKYQSDIEAVIKSFKAVSKREQSYVSELSTT